jgi:hypothetical protein
VAAGANPITKGSNLCDNCDSVATDVFLARSKIQKFKVCVLHLSGLVPVEFATRAYRAVVFRASRALIESILCVGVGITHDSAENRGCIYNLILRALSFGSAAAYSAKFASLDKLNELVALAQCPPSTPLAARCENTHSER